MPHNENWPKRLRVRNDPGSKRPTKIGRNDPRPNLGRNDPGRNDPAETTQGRNVPDSFQAIHIFLHRTKGKLHEPVH